MAIDRGRPLWEQVAADIRDGIRDGTYAPGAQLPSEGQLAAQYDVSGTTVKSAFNHLAGEGLITRRQGRPATVTERPPLILTSELIGSEDGFYTMLERAGQRSGTVTTVERGPAASAADWLGIEADTEVTIRHRKMKAEGGRMLMVADSYFPDWVIEQAPALADPAQHGMPTHLREAFGPTYSEDWVVPREATEAEARDLEIQPGDAVLQIQGLTRDHQERTLHYIYVVSTGRLPRHYRYGEVPDHKA